VTLTWVLFAPWVGIPRGLLVGLGFLDGMFQRKAFRVTYFLTLQSTMRRTGLVLAWGGAWVVGGWGLAGGQEWPYALRICIYIYSIYIIYIYIYTYIIYENGPKQICNFLKTCIHRFRCRRGGRGTGRQPRLSDAYWSAY
jgi:hypothetical protein